MIGMLDLVTKLPCLKVLAQCLTNECNKLTDLLYY